MWLLFLILASSDIEVSKSDKGGVEFVYTPGECLVHPAIYLRNTAPQPEPGKPSLPVRYVVMGVPIGATVDVRVLESSAAESTGISVPSAHGFTQEERDETIYSTDAFWPAEVVSIQEQALYRGQEILRLRINPVLYNPVRNRLLIHKKLRIGVTFHGGSGTQKRDRIFDPVFESVLINYEQARNWRVKSPHKPLLHSPGPWYKIELKGEGIYKLDRGLLTSIGIPSVDPKTIKIFNGGSKMVTDATDTLKQISIRVLPDTSILFYGASLNGWGKNGQGFVNPYTNTNVYWLTYGRADGRRDSISGVLIPDLDIQEWFPDTLHVEEDILCPGKSGLGWVWEKLIREKESTSFKRDHTFNVPAVHDGTCNIEVAVHGWVSTFKADQGLSKAISHNVRLYLNGTQFADTNWKNRGDEDVRPTLVRGIATGLRSGTNTLTFEMYRDSLTKDIVFFDWLEVSYKREYQSNEGKLKFKGTTEDQQFEITGFSEMPVIFEVTDALDPRLVCGAVYEGGSVRFRGNESRYFASTDPEVPFMKEESPYDLRTPGVVDFVIISHPEFMDYAKALKNHREEQGLRSKVFSVEDVYNSFSAGLRHSPYSIRNLLSFAYDNWGTAYCLLLGAGTYAYKKEELIKNRIPVYEGGYRVGEYGYPPRGNRCDDHWYTDRNLAIGRITAETKKEARDVIVEKIIRYEQNPGVWQNRILLISDDEAENGPAFVNHAEDIAEDIGANPGYDIFKIYGTNYPLMGREKPTARYDLIRNWTKGHFLTFFGGHGNLVQLCDEVMLENPRDLNLLRNGIRLPFSHFWSCGVGCFERETRTGMADLLGKMKGGGSIGTLASTRETGGDGGIGARVAHHFLINPQRTIGQGVYGIMLDIGLPANSNLFSDPATRLPSRTITVTIDSFADTVTGGTLLGVYGTAQGANFAHITVMSSEYDTTIAGCNYRMRGRMMDFQISEDILFEGTVIVKNDNWYHEFIVPVELDDLLCGERGKISVHAWNDTACGNAAVEVAVARGEANPNDTLGPRIQFYADGKPLQDNLLVPSDFTLTCVLEDESGINVLNRVRPRNLILSLQVNSGELVPLADHFQYDLGSCRRGGFSYPLQLDPLDLTHTLALQASDNLGNRSLHEVAVQVLSSTHLEIGRVVNYPNPVRGEHTWFTFFLSKPAVVRIRIFTVSGRLIRTMGLENKSSGLNQIYWDTRDELGNRIGNGIYIYKIEAECDALSKEETSEVSKLMILR
jgi:hypothetical protein